MRQMFTLGSDTIAVSSGRAIRVQRSAALLINLKTKPET